MPVPAPATPPRYFKYCREEPDGSSFKTYAAADDTGGNPGVAAVALPAKVRNGPGLNIT